MGSFLEDKNWLACLSLVIGKERYRKKTNSMNFELYYKLVLNIFNYFRKPINTQQRNLLSIKTDIMTRLIELLHIIQNARKKSEIM